MRTRAVSLSAVLVLIALVAAVIGSRSPASARLQTTGTPAASPAANGTPVAADETPTAEATETGIITIVLWYQQNDNGELLYLYPVTSTDTLIYSAESLDNDARVGRIVFEESRNDGYPRIRIGDGDYFDAYPVYAADPNTVQRWLYFDDDPTVRPSTMVMQINGIRGTYDGWAGTATFISRGGDQGGLVVIALRPPE
jgi:hypothetical protein